MIKKIFVLFMMCASCFILTAQQSLISSATNRLFTNANDWIMKPNVNFNLLENSYIIVAGEFGSATSNVSNSGNGVAELGYYHAGKVPFALSTALDMSFPKDGKKEYDVTARGTLGLPMAKAKYFSNFSLGVLFHAAGSEIKNFEKKSNFFFSVPFGMQLGPIYNILVPRFQWRSQKRDNNVSTGAVDVTDFTFLIYDKVTFKSLIPTGKETAIWAAYSNLDSMAIDELEIPAFGDLSDKNTNIQVGISNRIDFTPIEYIRISLNPKIYFDYRNPSNEENVFGYTIASDVGIFAKVGQSPVALYMAMTPRLRIYHTHTKRTGQDDDFEFDLSTNVLWSGRLGINIGLPRNSEFDITCNINTSDQFINLSAQFTIALPDKKNSKH